MIPKNELDALRNYLEKQAPLLESLVPEQFRKHYQRFVKIGIVYILGNEDRIRCTDESLLECMLKAAQIGLAVDGRMAHMIPYQLTVPGPDGKNMKISNAVLQLDYKGIVAVMKRSPKIKDVFARIVYKGDKFKQNYEGPVATLVHEPSDDPKRSTSQVVGVYSMIVFADGYWRHEYMDFADIERIKGRAASAKGPWSTDYAEMAKKTVIKRQSKLEMDIEEIDYLMEAVAREDEMESREVVPETMPTGAISYEKQDKAGFANFATRMAEKVPTQTTKSPDVVWKDKEAPWPMAVDKPAKEDMPEPKPEKDPTPTMAMVPDWAAQVLDELSKCVKYGPTMSMGNALMTQFCDQSTTDQDRVNWYPTLFEEWSKKIQPMIQPIDKPTLLKKLTAWQPQLGAIHGMIMQVLKPTLG